MKVKTDYFGRVVGWKPINKKPRMYFQPTLPPKVCSKCGKLYMDTWTVFCGLDGKWLIDVSRLDIKHRKLIGFTNPSKQPKGILTEWID